LELPAGIYVFSVLLTYGKNGRIDAVCSAVVMAA